MTVSAKKLYVTTPEVVILGHKCNYEGHIPDNSKISKICDWPLCKSLSDVYAFLGIVGYMHIWIKNYSAIAQPLVNLTRKGTTFVWEEEQEQAMQALKDAIINSPSLISIDYSADCPVYLSIDSSWHRVGWILSQECPDSRRHPSCFSSITWNEQESCYSQAKIKLYRLFHALHTLHLYIVGIRQLVVKMDAKYIRGMINNPDIQPNATINWWIAAIRLFDFELVHVPADKHHRPDGLSQREPADSESNDKDDLEEWIDHALSLGLWIMSWPHAISTDRPLAVWTLNTACSPTSDSENTFPISDKTSKADKEIEHIWLHLSSLPLPADFDDTACTHLAKWAKRFLIADDRLW
jgi:hypothetical protein